MVSQAQELDTQAQNAVEVMPKNPDVLNARVGGEILLCPRCEARLHINYDEPQCLQCGYVDYSYVPPNAHRRKRSLMSTGTRHVLRYSGGFTKLTNTLTHVQLKRYRNRAIYLVTCPFCHQMMEQSSLSGKRREVREERYKCEQGHRISLIPTKGGALSWK